MPVVYSTIDCCEMHATVQEQMGTGSFTASVQLKVAWADRIALMQDLIGSVWPYASAWGKPPVCNSAGVVPFPAEGVENGQAITYEHAIVTAQYSTDEDQDLITESLEPVVEFITLDPKRFRWGASSGDPLLEGEAPGRQMRSLNLVRTMKRLASVPVAVRDLAGCVNDTAYNSTRLGINFAAETLLYAGPQMSNTITTSGDQGWDLTVKYAYQPQGWNQYFRTKTGDFEEIVEVYDGTPYKSYPPEDFSTLLF